MKYELKHPFAYKKNADTQKETMCRAIEFRRPKGKEANKVFALVSSLAALGKDGVVPDDLADRVLAMVDDFASIVGDKDFDIDMVSGNLDSSDIMELSGVIAENFT